MVCFCLVCATLSAQSSIIGGALEGIVTDPSGARVPGATVIAREPETGRTRQVSTGGEGVFRIPELPPGTYQISVSFPGFAPYRHSGVGLQLGSTVHLDIALTLAGTEAVTVSAQPPALDPAQTSVSSAVDTERIEELPVESRNYLNFALLAPGVSGSAQQAGNRPSTALADSGFSFGGLRARSNNISIDGLDNNDEYTGASRTELSLETVREFQVVTAGLSAESGGASGGSINVVTRTGANDLHGDAFLFVENGALNAREPFGTEPGKPGLHRYRTGAALGGPAVRDRTFYYAAFEQEHNRSQEEDSIAPAVVETVNQTLAAGAYPGVAARRIGDGSFPAARAETEASAKLDHRLDENNSLMLRYALTNNREAGDAFNAEGWNDASARGSSFIRDQAVAGALTTVFGGRAVGDFRFQAADRRAVLRTTDGAGAGIEIAGLVNFGRPYTGNGRRGEDHLQATYTFARSAGRHLWKAGAAANRVALDAAMADGFGGLYRFATPADFAAGRPDSFRQAFGAPETRYAVATFGAFAQDHWTATRTLTLDLGIRADGERLPRLFREAGVNFGPRAGMAWQAGRGWVVRAGYGVFFDRYVLANLNRAVQKDGVQAFELVLDAGARAVGPSIYRPDPRLATPYSQQADFAIERLLARNMTATLTYLLVRGVKLSRTRNVNLLPPGPVFDPGRADPRFNDIYQLEDSASSGYNGVSFTLNRRMADELAFSASYTFSKTRDDASDFDEQPQNPFDLRPEWALSRQDQRQRLVFNALWELPIGDEESGRAAKSPWERVFGHLEAAPIFTVESGRPVNPLTGIDNNRSHAFPLAARPPGMGRNSRRTPMLANMDFRLVKYFPTGKTSRFDVVAEAFNLFNRTNVAASNPVFGPAFLQPLAGAGARRVEFSLDFEF